MVPKRQRTQRGPEKVILEKSEVNMTDLGFSAE